MFRLASYPVLSQTCFAIFTRVSNLKVSVLQPRPAHLPATDFNHITLLRHIIYCID